MKNALLGNQLNGLLEENELLNRLISWTVKFIQILMDTQEWLKWFHMAMRKPIFFPFVDIFHYFADKLKKIMTFASLITVEWKPLPTIISSLFNCSLFHICLLEMLSHLNLKCMENLNFRTLVPHPTKHLFVQEVGHLFPPPVPSNCLNLLAHSRLIQWMHGFRILGVHKYTGVFFF